MKLYDEKAIEIIFERVMKKLEERYNLSLKVVEGLKDRESPEGRECIGISTGIAISLGVTKSEYLKILEESKNEGSSTQTSDQDSSS